MRKGEINIVGLLAIGVTIAISSIGGFFYQTNRTSQLETRTALLEYQYAEINKKLDTLIGNQVQTLGQLLGSATTT